MLDSWIIDQLKRREQEERERAQQQPRLELPVDDRIDPSVREDRREDEEERDRGVIIIDL